MKGAVIDSKATPDKNKLDTGSLTYSDIQNKAEYKATSSTTGFGFKDGKVNLPVTLPDMPVKGNADSTTKSAVAPGTIIVGGKEVNPEGLSRDSSSALNALGKIFDKKTVKEKQELAKVFGQEAFKAVGDLAEKHWEKAIEDASKVPVGSEAYKEAMGRAASWDDGGINKILLHSVVGGIMSSIGGNGFASGAVSAGLNEAIQKELSKIKDDSLHQLLSAAIGAAAANVVGGNAQVGAAAAASATKYNWQNGHDKNYSPAVQSMLLKLTALYYAAEEDPEEQARIAAKANEIRGKLENNNFIGALDTFSSWASSLAATNSIFGSSSRAERDAILAEVRQYDPNVDAGDNEIQDNIFFVAGFAIPTTKANLLFKTGRSAEGHLLGEVGGVAQKYFLTSLGGRFVDVLSNGVAYESKVGYVPLTDFVKKQVLKDAELLNNPNSGVNAVEWKFYRSGITGKIGPSQPLIDFLEQHGIKYEIIK